MDFRRNQHALARTGKTIPEEFVDLPAANSGPVEQRNAEVECAMNKLQGVRFRAALRQSKTGATPTAEPDDAGNKIGPAEANIFHCRSLGMRHRISRWDDAIPIQCYLNGLGNGHSMSIDWQKGQI